MTGPASSFLEYPLGAEDRLLYSAGTYSIAERAILLEQVKARTPDDIVHQFWADRAFASVSDRAASLGSSAGTHQSRPQGGA